MLKQKHPDKVVPVKLDVTKINDVIACYELCKDTEILVNNAGVECATRFLGEKSLKASQFEMAVNYFGVHNLCHTFWNSLKSKQSASDVWMLKYRIKQINLRVSQYLGQILLEYTGLCKACNRHA